MKPFKTIEYSAPVERWLYLLPLLFLPLMLTLRVFPFVAPNEEPKWLLLTLLGGAVGLLFALWMRGTTRVDLRASWPALLLLFYFLCLFAGIFVAPNEVEGAIRFAFWLFAAMVWLVAVQASQRLPDWRNWLAWSTSIGGTLFSLFFWSGYLLDYGKPNYNIKVLFSPIGHVNFTGDVLIILLPFLIWALFSYAHPVMRVLNWFNVLTVTSVLLIASSRGALGGLALGVLILLLPVLRHLPHDVSQIKAGWRNHWPASMWVVSALLFAVVSYQLLPYHFRDLARISGTIQTASTALGKNQEGAAEMLAGEQPPMAAFWRGVRPLIGTDRAPMYASATAMTLDAPLLGQGTGNFPFVYPAFSNRYPEFRDHLSSATTFTTNPHNVLLQIATENGLPAVFAFMTLLLLFWGRLLLSMWRQWNGFLAMGLLAVTAAIFDSMFNHVFFNPASMFVFALFGAVWWAALGEGASVRTLWQRTVRLGAKPAFLAAFVTLVVIFWPLRWIASEWHVGQAMVAGYQPAVAMEEYRQAYDLDPYNFRAVFGVGQMAYAGGQYGRCIEVMRQFENISPYNAPALNMLGAAYMMSGDFAAAEDAFQRALRVLPDFTLAQQNLTMLQGFRLQQSGGMGGSQ